jgi:hypothetical protein
MAKYVSGNLIPMFRKAAKFRNEMVNAGFTDNGGAIHSAARILDLLGLHLNYPSLDHINNLRGWKGAEFSVQALAAHNAGKPVRIEHVSPLRDFTREAIKIERQATDGQLEEFVKARYRLVLLTPDETLQLNKKNRSKMSPDRLAGITFVKRRAAGRKAATTRKADGAK